MAVRYIRKRKLPDGIGLWGACQTAHDAFGTWLFTPRGSIYRDEAVGKVSHFYVGSPEWPGIPAIHAIPLGRWWIATFRPEDEATREVAFDICTSPKLEGRVWEFVDLELDMWLDRESGEAKIEDQDEFDHAIACGIIGADDASGALASVAEIQAILADHSSGFVSTGRRLLADAIDLQLQPITDLP